MVGILNIQNWNGFLVHLSSRAGCYFYLVIYLVEVSKLCVALLETVKRLRQIPICTHCMNLNLHF